MTTAARSAGALEERPDPMRLALEEFRRRLLLELAGALELDPLGPPRRTARNRAILRAMAIVRQVDPT